MANYFVLAAGTTTTVDTIIIHAIIRAIDFTKGWTIFDCDEVFRNILFLVVRHDVK